MRAFIGGTILAAWLSVTAACNLVVSGRRIRQRDLLGLVPEWRFFAPNPVDRDLVLLHRAWSESVPVSGWRQVGVPARRRELWNPLWNPEKRRQKSLIDLVNDLAGHYATLGYLPVMTVSYLALLNVVSSQPQVECATHVQFAVLGRRELRGNVETSVVLMSFRHPLDRAALQEDAP
jgi:hypothetical protein